MGGILMFDLTPLEVTQRFPDKHVVHYHEECEIHYDGPQGSPQCFWAPVVYTAEGVAHYCSNDIFDPVDQHTTWII